MRLKSLELKGFKSFAHDTTIHFNEDVIGIVGPNGSGKSNVVDAIRWVLGEQSGKELRLDKMASVIFNGTKTRKPANHAQVTITFDNNKALLPTEYATVAISRILYRSGDSEYRLNGVTCRLKDIHTLLMDTGIGSDTYAIIALGMVDDILSDKENSRRRMLEQAAGVSKYKARKRETLLKLQGTTENLDRVEDLLFEIENNMKLLEKQARRTQKYFDLKEQYKTLSIRLAGVKLFVLKNRYKQLEEQISRETDQYRALDAEISQLESGLEEEKRKNLDKEKNLSEHQRELNQLVGKLRGMEGDKKMMSQKQQFLQEQKLRLQDQIDKGKGRIELLRQESDNYRIRLQEEKLLEAEREQVLEREEAAVQSQQATVGQAKTELDSVLRQLQELERQLFEQDKAAAVNQGQILNHRSEIERATRENSERQINAGNNSLRLEQLDQQIRDQQARLDLLNQAEESRKQSLQESRQQFDQLNTRLAATNRSADQKQNEFQLTKSLVENMEGYPESIKFLYKQKEWAKSCPLLADILYTAEANRALLEQYLEPYLNYFVAPNQAIAAEAIRMLREQQKGKAFFFLVNELPEPHLLEPPVKGAKRALDLVESDPAYNRLFRYLLGNVFILPDHLQAPEVEDLDEAAILINHDGHMIRSFARLSGGSLGLFEGKTLGRRKNLERLEKDIQKLQKDKAQLEEEKAQLKQRIDSLQGENRESEIRQLGHALNQQQQERAQLQARLEAFQEQQAQNERKIAEAQANITELEARNLQSREHIVTLQAEQVQLQASISGKDEDYQQLAAALSNSNAAFNQARIEFIKQQNLVTTLQREISYRDKQIEDLVSQAENTSIEWHQAEREEGDLSEQIEKIAYEIQVAYQDRKLKESDLNEAEQTYYSARNAILELEDKLRKTGRQRQDLQILVNTLKDKFNDVKFELNGLGERLRIEFGVEINSLINNAPEEGIDETELRVEVERIKSRLDNFGEINPMAVEAYNEMNERFTTITVQRDDILEAKKSLEQTIREIEETATQQFLGAFEQVRSNFIHVFRSLFTEDDNCDLILENPDAPLESGIQIIAKPKGKRPQSLNQLSGGEKTLTATALLFALYLLKPAPFCIFDEVDAPLDDANIEKFNRIIHKFSGDSQFVIVTHNKQTMAAVDVIYGVFMEEMGISGVSQVDFRSFQHTNLLETVN